MLFAGEFKLKDVE